uniref:Putative transcription factor n=1 Tax=viral metagenome TaxID=1070528 RepID=A0A6M3KEH8_9ZZZZ
MSDRTYHLDQENRILRRIIKRLEDEIDRLETKVSVLKQQIKDLKEDRK